MAFQKTVNTKLAFGVVGSFYDDSPRRVAPYSVTTGGIGKVYTVDPTDPTKAVLGGTGIFAGLAVNSKEYVIRGLTASLSFEPFAIAQLATMGHVIVECENAVEVGQAAFYNQTTGAIKAAAAGSSEDGYTEIKGSKFIFVAAAQGEVAVLELND